MPSADLAQLESELLELDEFDAKFGNRQKRRAELERAVMEATAEAAAAKQMAASALERAREQLLQLSAAATEQLAAFITAVEAAHTARSAFDAAARTARSLGVPFEPEEPMQIRAARDGEDARRLRSLINGWLRLTSYGLRF